MLESLPNLSVERRAAVLLTVLVLVLSGTGCSRRVNGDMGMGGSKGAGMMMSHGQMGGMMHPGTESPSTNETAPASKSDGARVYASACATCHGPGLAGAPRYGDQSAWATRIKQGRDLLYDRALHGYRAMPPKGGHMDLSDAQVEAAVDYLVKAGGGWGK